jgi:hypothetical protein
VLSLTSGLGDETALLFYRIGLPEVGRDRAVPVLNRFGWQDAFVFEARSTKIKQEPDLGTCCSEVGDDLGNFFIAEVTGEGFIFNDDAFVNPMIEVESSEPLLLGVVEFEVIFFLGVKSDALEFAGEGALVVFFAQSTGCVAVDAHGGSDDLVGEMGVGEHDGSDGSGWRMGGVEKLLIEEETDGLLLWQCLFFHLAHFWR